MAMTKYGDKIELKTSVTVVVECKFCLEHGKIE